MHADTPDASSAFVHGPTEPRPEGLSHPRCTHVKAANVLTSSGRPGGCLTESPERVPCPADLRELAEQGHPERRGEKHPEGEQRVAHEARRVADRGQEGLLGTRGGRTGDRAGDLCGVHVSMMNSGWRTHIAPRTDRRRAPLTPHGWFPYAFRGSTHR